LTGYTVLATDNLNQGEFVANYTGNLRKQEEFDEIIGDDNDIRHLWTYSISQDHYQGPPLIIEAVSKGNEARFFNDPSGIQI
jgi:hypothetical protein